MIIGGKTQSELQKLPASKQKEMLLGIKSFLKTVVSYLQTKLPLSNNVLKNISCLDPGMWNHATSELCFRQLLSTFAHMLCDGDDSRAMDEWKLLTLDETTPEWTVNQTATARNELQPVRIDVVWKYVLHRKNDFGKLKYPTLGKVVRACLALPHGNADVERSFSLNKNTVTEHRVKLEEHTINAIRLVKDGIKFHGGSATAVLVNKDLLGRTRAACLAYRGYLESQKKREEDKKRQQESEHVEKLKRQEKKKEIQGKRQEIEREESELEAEEKTHLECLKNTEALLKEAEQKLAESISAKDFDKASVSQAMLEIANKRITAANSSLVQLEKKRRTLQAQKQKLEDGTAKTSTESRNGDKTKRPAESTSSAILPKRHCVDK